MEGFMGRKQRGARSTPATYIPFGKPDEVEIVRVDYGAGDKPDVRYVETYRGSSFSSVTDSKRISKSDDHAEGCAGQHGVDRLWWRGGRGWCQHCYSSKWGIHPALDDKLETPPGTPQVPASRPSTMFDSFGF